MLESPAGNAHRFHTGLSYEVDSSGGVGYTMNLASFPCGRLHLDLPATSPPPLPYPALASVLFLPGFGVHVQCLRKMPLALSLAIYANPSKRDTPPLRQTPTPIRKARKFANERSPSTLVDFGISSHTFLLTWREIPVCKASKTGHLK
jgi:hypothetical protein